MYCHDMKRLKLQFGFKLVIIGGAESHLVASLLATAGVPVILSPFMAAPNTFETW